MKINFAKIAVPVSALLLSAAPAFAIPTLTITDGINTDMFSSVSPIISMPTPLTLGIWSVSEQVFYAGSPSNPFWDMDILAQTMGAGTLTSTFTYDNLTPTALSEIVAQNGGSVFSIPVGATITVTDTIYKNGVPLLTIHGLPGPGSPLSALYSSAAVYTLSEKVTLTSAPNLKQTITISSDSGAAVTPIPDSGATLMLLGTSLTALGLFSFRKQAKR